MQGRDMKRLFELLTDVVGEAHDAGPDPEALALMQAARRLVPDLDWLLAMRLLDSGGRVAPVRPVRSRGVAALSALSLARRTD